ncbi:MAG: ABC transporter permease, partial [candidate division Zixibacteria bacterium]|nr:ABC transporter permease [candidate division Zixibacteria bacterium]
DRDDLTEEDRNRSPITIGEAEAILENCTYVEGVSPQDYYFQQGGNEAKYKNRKFSSPYLMGTWPDFVKVNNKDVSQGRFINEIDNRHRLAVCALGKDVAEVLFPGEYPIGKEIRVNSNKFQVVGVMEKVETNFDNDELNRTVAIPLSTFLKIYPWEEELFLMVRARSYEAIQPAVDEITGVLRAHRKVPFNKKDDFALSTQDQFKDFIGNITKYIYLAMIVITSVGLMVGGIGVMNIMLVSVTERTREIGIRKAIGAKRSNITVQFLTEAMALSGTGGVIGILFGITMGLLINMALGFPLSISMFWAVVGFIVSVSVGLVSGIYPAMKAARLDPIEALHYE